MNANVKFQPSMLRSQIETASGVSFHRSGHVDKKQKLFSVNAGVDLEDALNSISDLLDLAEEPIFEAGMGEPLRDNAAWRVHFVLQAAKAGVDSLLQALATENAELRMHEARIA